MAPALVLLTVACGAEPSAPVPVLATTTSVEDTGLSDEIRARFAKTGSKLRMVAVGSGEAIEMARRGDADAILTHSPEAEVALVREGGARRRVPIMVNDFVIVGPETDPAGIRGRDAVRALQRLAAAPAAFISRGDDSGTHQKEVGLLREAGVAPGWEGYRESAAGQAVTLQVANERRAYALTDRGSLRRLAPTLELALLVEGDPRLRNPYHALVVRPVGEAVVDFLASRDFQRFLADFGAQAGEMPWFCPVTEPPAACSGLLGR